MKVLKQEMIVFSIASIPLKPYIKGKYWEDMVVKPQYIYENTSEII